MPERIDIEIAGKADSVVAAARDTEKALEKVIARTKDAGGSTNELEAELARLRQSNAQAWTAEYTRELGKVIEEQKAAGKSTEDLERRLKAMQEASEPAARGVRTVGSTADEGGRHLRRMSEAGGAATQVMSNLERASRGGTDAIFGLAGAVRGVIQSVTAATGWFGYLVAALGLAGGAFLALKDKIFPAKESLEALQKPLDDAVERLQELNKARLESLRSEISGVRQEAEDTAKTLERLLRLRNDIQSANEDVEIARIETDTSIPETERIGRVAEIRRRRREREAGTPVEVATEAEKQATRVRDRAVTRDDAAQAEAADAQAALDRLNLQGEDLLNRQRAANRRLERANEFSLTKEGGQEFVDAQQAVLETLREIADFKQTLRSLGPILEERARSTAAEASVTRRERESAEGSLADATGRRQEAEARVSGVAAARAEEERIRTEAAIRRAREEQEREAQRAQEEARRRAAAEGARSLGRDVRGAVGQPGEGSTLESRTLFQAVNRAAEALDDGGTAGEFDRLAASIGKLADAAEQAGSASAGRYRRLLGAVEQRIAKLEAQMARNNDGR